MDSWPNQEALNKALNIYRASMRSFIISHLKKIPGTNVEDVVIDSVGDWRADEIDRSLSEPGRDIEFVIDINDFPHLVNKNWEEAFERTLNDDKTFRNQLWLIVECRNADWAHPPKGDAEFESTRAHLFLIADVLGKINRSDAKDSVEVIRDELDDTAERLADAEERLKVMEAENADYKKSLVEAEKHLKTAELEKTKYVEQNVKLSNQVDEKEKRVKKISKQLEDMKSKRDEYKKQHTSALKQLEKMKTAHATCEEDIKTKSDQLDDAVGAWFTSEEHLAAMRKLFTTATIGTREVQAVFPPFGTDSAVRVLDRRGTDKRNYLLALLEQKQPTFIYVQSEEMVETLLDHIVPEKADFIEKHGKQTSEAEETKILEKLRTGELVAIVSDTTFSTSIPSHCIEHFVFCHLAPSSDAFFNRCQPAFTSANNAYLHFIYESKQNVEELVEKYPNEEMLRKLYQKFRDRTPINTEFINPDNLYNKLCKENELDITNLGIETGFSIFEELGFLEKNEEGIRRLSTLPRKLEESKIYCRGKKLKEEIANSPAFQHEHSIEQIWEKMLEELNIDSEQILRENITHKMPLRISETEGDYLKDFQIQPEQPTEVVEIDNREVAKSTKTKSRKKKPSIAERYIAETTVEDRDGIAAKVVELRINATGSKPLAWREIREKLGLHNDQFHKVIRPSEGYRKAVIQRIKSLKAQEDGWEYNGKLEVLTGIELTEKDLE